MALCVGQGQARGHVGRERSDHRRTNELVASQQPDPKPLRGSKTQKVNPAVVPTCVGLLEGSRSYPPCRRLVQNLERSTIMTASEATPQEFHDNHYRDAHEEYIWWLRYNPRGFVMNLETTKRAFLHESDCMHIAHYSDRDVRLTDKRKVCASSTSAPLKLWASKCGIKWT